MIYPDEFKSKCIQLFPGWKGLHELLDKGSVYVGRYLCDSIKTFDAEDILNTNHDELIKNAERQKKISGLYQDWREIYAEANK